MKRRSILAMLLAALLVCSSAACAAPQSTSSSVTQQADSGQWVNASLLGQVTAGTKADVKDDFHLAVNQKWLANTQMPAGYITNSSFAERTIEVDAQIQKLLDSDTAKGEEAGLVRTYYRAFLDMDARNARGIQPVLPIVKDIQNIKSIQEFTDYVCKNPSGLSQLPMTVELYAHPQDSTSNIVCLSCPSLTLSRTSEYQELTEVGKRTQLATSTLFQKMLVRCGYSETEAKDLYEKMFALEKEMALASLEDDKEEIEDPVVTFEELAKASPKFPMAAALQSYKDAGVTQVAALEPNWIDRVNELYTEENLEAFKAMLLYRNLITFASFLDQQALDDMGVYVDQSNGLEAKSDLKAQARGMVDQLFGMAVGQMYAENCVSPAIKQDVTDMIREILAVYRGRLQNNDWLSDATKQKAIEKLDAMKIRVAYPDDWSLYDYSSLDFKDTDGVFEMSMAIHKYNEEQKVQRAVHKIDANLWSVMSPQAVNAFYSPVDNSINIPAGILGGAFYNPQASEGQQMGGIGMIIAHEITHAFDPNGSKYDKDGNMNDWWTQEDHEAFEKRTDAIEDYYSQFEPLPGVPVNGEQTIGETVADLGGMSCMMELAKGRKDFDYDEFFRSFAQVWKDLLPEQMIQQQMLTDPHPLGYLRTNVNVQQMQEFYDTYGVKEGDGMYLAPEKRLALW